MKKHLKKVNLEILFKKKVIKVYSIHQSVKVMTKEMLQIEGNYRDKQLSVMWDPEPDSYTEKNTREKSGRILMKSLVYSVALYRREFSGFDNCTMITEDVNIIGQLDEGSTWTLYSSCNVSISIFENKKIQNVYGLKANQLKNKKLNLVKKMI